MTKTVVTLLILAAVFFFLYRGGRLTFSSKRAAMFVGYPCRPGRWGARFAACTGTTRRVVKFRDSRTYHFILDPQLTAGELTVELLDSHKATALTLDAAHPRGSITVEVGRRYELVSRFASASGAYELTWE